MYTRKVCRILRYSWSSIFIKLYLWLLESIQNQFLEDGFRKRWLKIEAEDVVIPLAAHLNLVQMTFDLSDLLLEVLLPTRFFEAQRVAQGWISIGGDRKMLALFFIPGSWWDGDCRSIRIEWCAHRGGFSESSFASYMERAQFEEHVAGVVIALWFAVNIERYWSMLGPIKSGRWIVMDPL